jgi:hypothetical protein
MKKEIEEGCYLIVNSEEITNCYSDNDGIPVAFQYNGDVYPVLDTDAITRVCIPIMLKDGQAVRGLMSCIEACINSLDECVDVLEYEDSLQELEDGEYIDYVINTTLKLLTNKNK